MADNLCPTCHSRIHDEPLQLSHRRRGSLKPGLSKELPDIIISSTDEVVPLWTDDPCLTRSSFNGPGYEGIQKNRAVWFEELQEVRHNEEVEAGIPEDLQTQFSPVRGQHLKIQHIIELRESVEKILNAVGLTLADYFSLDPDGNAVEPGPNDVEDKEEWTDVSRGQEYIRVDGTKSGKFSLPDGTEKESPTILKLTHFKAAHLEDLRHPIQLGWREFWSVTPEVAFYDSIQNGQKPSYGINGLEPKPTDGGSVYTTDGQKTWLFQSVTSSGGGAFVSVNGSILDDTDEDVISKKLNANKLRLKYDFISPPGVNFANATSSIKHNFVDIGDGFVPVSPRIIKIGKDTYFKIFVRTNGFRILGGIGNLGASPTIVVRLRLSLDGIADDFFVSLFLGAAFEQGQIITAPLTGMQFDTRVTTSIPTLESFLAAGHEIKFEPSAEYDASVNIDDFLEALKNYQISGTPVGSFFNYVSQKKLADGNIVANPDATKVTIKSVEITYTALGSSNLTVTNIIDTTAIRIENKPDKIRS